MANTPEQIKSIVEGWIKTVGKSYKDITQQQNNPDLAFVFTIANLVIYMMNNRQDRVVIETQLNFAHEHQEGTANLNDTDFIKLILEITEPLSLAQLTCIFGQDKQNPKQINKITINGWIDTDSLNRSDFYKVWDRVSSFNEITIKKIQCRFGVRGVLNTSSNSSNTNQTPYG